MNKQEQLLIRIQKLQDTRDYADEVESVRLTRIIETLLQEIDKSKPPEDQRMRQVGHPELPGMED